MYVPPPPLGVIIAIVAPFLFFPPLCGGLVRSWFPNRTKAYCLGSCGCSLILTVIASVWVLTAVPPFPSHPIGAIWQYFVLAAICNALSTFPAIALIRWLGFGD